MRVIVMRVAGLCALVMVAGFLVGADSLRVGTVSMVGECRSRATARRAAIDTVTASWTIAGRGRRLCAAPVCVTGERSRSA